MFCVNGSLLSLVRDRLTCIADSVSLSGGVFVARREFSIPFGYDAAAFVEDVKAWIPGIEVLSFGEIFKPGSASSAVSRCSHWFVRFRIEKYPF